MAAEMRVAVVTGANKGIGLQIVRELCRKFQGVVYLTARDQKRGQEAVQKLNGEGLQPEFLRLDVDDTNSIKEFRRFLESKHGGLDILVNNAGILPHSSGKESFVKDAEQTIGTNFTGLLEVCDQLFPLLRSHARVVNVSSSLGALEYVKNPKVKERLLAKDLSTDELKQIMANYVTACKNGDYVQKGYSGYPEMYGAYPMSKVGVTALTRIQQRMFDQDNDRSDIVVNSVHPGYVNTDMTQGKGHLTVEQGADTPVYCALLPQEKGIPRGEFLSNRKVVDWSKT